MKMIRRYLVLFIVTFVSVVGLAALSYLTILNYSYENEENFITVCNEGVIEELSSSLAYGKDINNYYGIGEVLEKASGLLNEGSFIVLENAQEEAVAMSREGRSLSFTRSDYGEIRQDIPGPDGEKAATLVTFYEKKEVLEGLSAAAFKAAAGSAVLFLLILIICLVIGSLKNWESRQLIPIITAGIILQGVFLTTSYLPEFQKAADTNVKSVASYIGSTLESLVDKGVTTKDISDLDSYLNLKQEENPSIDRIFLEGEDKAVLEKNNKDSIIRPLSGSDEKLVLVFDKSEGYIRRNIIEMILTFAATIILAVIFMHETLTLSEMVAFKKSSSFNKPCREQFASIARNIRYGNFLSVTFDYMCISFSALQIKQWNQGAWGLAPEMAAALSISICSVADVLGMLCMQTMGKKLRGKHLMAGSALLLIAADLTCFMTHSTMIIIIMRFFAGLATAGVKQVRNRVISEGYETEEERSANLSASNNGVIGGILCGMGLGGVVAGVFGYAATFLAAGVGYLLYLCFEAYCLPWNLLDSRLPQHLAQAGNGAKNYLMRMLRVLGSLKVWRTILLVVTPQYFLLMVIVCLIPGRIQSHGLPGVVLTYSNLLNGLVGLYIGEKVYHFLERRLGSMVRIEQIMLFVGAVSLAVLDISLLPAACLLLSASLAGLVDGTGTPVTTDLFMENPVVASQLDDTEKLMLFTMLGSVVMAIAPFWLELCEKNMVWMFGSCAVLVIFALLLSKEYREEKSGRALEK